MLKKPQVCFLSRLSSHPWRPLSLQEQAFAVKVFISFCLEQTQLPRLLC